MLFLDTHTRIFATEANIEVRITLIRSTSEVLGRGGLRLFYLQWCMHSSVQRRGVVKRRPMRKPRFLRIAGNWWILDLFFDFTIGKSVESWLGKVTLLLLQCFPRGGTGAKVKIWSKNGNFRPFLKFMAPFFRSKSRRVDCYLISKRDHECTISINISIIQCNLTLPGPKYQKTRSSEIRVFHGFWKFLIS